MATIQSEPKQVKRKHSPELLRIKRAARALNIPWARVTRERDRLRQNEVDQRGHEDEARQVAWSYWIARNGWNRAAQMPWWRNGFTRLFGKKIAAGADYLAIRFADEIAGVVRESCPEFTEWSEGDIWDFLLSDYLPRRPVWEHYQHAILRLAAAQLPSGDAYASDEVDAELAVPF